MLNVRVGGHASYTPFHRWAMPEYGTHFKRMAPFKIHVANILQPLGTEIMIFFIVMKDLCSLKQGPELRAPVEPFPQPIMKWTEGLYRSVFLKYGDFTLRENGEPIWGFHIERKR